MKVHNRYVILHQVAGSFWFHNIYAEILKVIMIMFIKFVAEQMPGNCTYVVN